jgi:acetate CoA/acetoacetate CoA-transferase beta subunit
VNGKAMIGKELIARRVALELQSGTLVNLGIGLPTLVADHIPPTVVVRLESENGLIGMGARAAVGFENFDLTDAGSNPVTILPGAASFDSSMSFGLIRGGHVDVTVLGGLQVDSKGRLANWMIPGVKIPGMGGAMDLLNGAKRVIVAMQHQTGGESKIVETCSLPLTSVRRVDLIVTELAVFEPTATGLVLREFAPGVTIDEVRLATQASFEVATDVHEMRL